MSRKILKISGLVCLFGFAFVGLFLTAGFFAVKFHLTDASGRIDLNDRYFAQSASAIRSVGQTSVNPSLLATNLCRAQALRKIFPENGSKILATYELTRSDVVLAKMLASAELYAGANSNYQTERKKCDDENSASSVLSNSQTDANLYGWISTPEWQTMKAALSKDIDVINQVSAQIGVPARLIVAQIVGEQLRLFHDNREVFKQFFQPLKILGNEVQFSLGVAGIKEETAKQIERNLTDKSSAYYLGPDYEKMLAFKTADPNQERFARLTDEHDRTYSYLYTALFLKQVETQWQKAGFDISDRPEILATIFNVGFIKSVPKADPQVGGSDITINGRVYTFGSLAYEFYYSGEMGDEFPVK